MKDYSKVMICCISKGLGNSVGEAQGQSRDFNSIGYMGVGKKKKKKIEKLSISYWDTEHVAGHVKMEQCKDSDKDKLLNFSVNRLPPTFLLSENYFNSPHGA